MSKFDKYVITPNEFTTIKSRSECNPYYDAFYSEMDNKLNLENATLPIFVSPMACIVNEFNYMEFIKRKLIPIIPRTVDYSKRLELMNMGIWVAMGLSEFETFVNNTELLSTKTSICVDLANGHMLHLIKLCEKAKLKFGNNLVLMVGNVANYNVYRLYKGAKIDYIRCAIGTGGACLTTTITGVGIGDLLNFLTNLKFKKLDINGPKIVIDGGIHSIRDIIIALAAGADYVMCGKLFAKCKEACGEIIEKQVPHKNTIYTPAENGKPARIVEVNDYEFRPGRMYYGMSTERAQAEMNNSVIKPAEGKEEWVEIEYTLDDIITKFLAGIRSAMSYCNARELDEFIGKPTIDYNGC